MSGLRQAEILLLSDLRVAAREETVAHYKVEFVRKRTKVRQTTKAIGVRRLDQRRQRKHCPVCQSPGWRPNLCTVQGTG